MAGTTARYAWPYPEGSDVPNVPSRMLALAQGVETTVGGIDDRVAVIEGAWTAYTPTWTASVSNPSLGNGVLTGAYRKVGKSISIRINLTMGSTTSYGSGGWLLSLPPTMTAKPVAGHSVWPIWTGTAVCRDVSMSTYVTAVSYVQSAATAVGVISEGAAPSLNVDNDTPFAWATSDNLALQINYEIA